MGEKRYYDGENMKRNHYLCSRYDGIEEFDSRMYGIRL